jgi:Flp pilus assembly protein CpaB
MATHFGGASAVRLYTTKVRWLIGCLASLIVVLATAVVCIAWKSNTPPTSIDVVQNGDNKSHSTIEMLVTTKRIEEGSQLTREMFQSVDIDVEKLPAAALRTKDLDVVLNKYSSRMIYANTPLLLEDLSDNPPISKIRIPPGYRGVAIQVDRRTAVSGFVTPNRRVDVILTFVRRGQAQVTTLARFVKVISVGGDLRDKNHSTIGKQGTTVTLMVTEKDAKKIELARNMGNLSLSLIGEDGPPEHGVDGDTFGENYIFNDPPATQPELITDGTMYTRDPRTGRTMRYVLRNKRWAVDRSYIE